MNTERIKVGTVEVEVRFKPIKNLHLSVHPPDGHVTVASPDFYDLEKVKIYLATKLGWIKKEQKRHNRLVTNHYNPKTYVPDYTQ
jgi:predicted metal-dependent hydrolase